MQIQLTALYCPESGRELQIIVIEYNNTCLSSSPFSNVIVIIAPY